MGFTIDMVSGNISNITNGIDSVKAEAVSPIKPFVKNVEIENVESLPQEQLLPVSDTLAKPSNKPEYVIPPLLINRDVDSFLAENRVSKPCVS